MYDCYFYIVKVCVLALPLHTDLPAHVCFVACAMLRHPLLLPVTNEYIPPWSLPLPDVVPDHSLPSGSQGAPAQTLRLASLPLASPYTFACLCYGSWSIMVIAMFWFNCLSLVLCCILPQAGAAELGIPLYRHIANLAGNTKLVGGQRQ